MLAHLTLLPEVVALGAYEMNHVWAITFKDDTGVKRLLACKDVKVKEGRCLVIDRANQNVRLKMHWLLHNVPDEDVRVALAPFGRVFDVSRCSSRLRRPRRARRKRQTHSNVAISSPLFPDVVA